MAQTGYTPILIYSSSTASNLPSASNLTNSALGSELAINITDGKLFYKDNANAIQVIGWKTTPTSAGGTGLTSYTAGDLVYYASGTAFTKLAIGSSGNYLSSSGSAPQWTAPAALTKTDDTNVTLTLGGSASTALLNAASLTLGWTGQLSAARGGTGIGSYAVGDILYADTTSSLAKLADVATGNALISGGVGVAPSWGKIGLTTHVSGTLGVGNGGTGQSSNLTQYGVIYGSTTTAMASTAAGTSTQVLHGNASGAPTWGAVSLTADVSGTLPVANGGTNLASYAAGDLLYASGTTTISKLGIGAANRVLTSSGSAPQWSQDITVGILTWTSKLTLSGNGSTPGASELAIGTNGAGSRLVYNVATGGEHNFAVNGSNQVIIANAIFAPIPDNTVNLGNGSLRWKEVFAANGTINTSDAREKQQVADLTQAEKAVANRIKALIKTFKFNDSVAKKGDAARIHVGVMAQDVAAAFEAEGLDPNRYSLFCYDQWDDKWTDEVENQMVMEDGLMVEKSVPTGKKILEIAAGNRYGIRYEQLLAFVIAAS